MGWSPWLPHTQHQFLLLSTWHCVKATLPQKIQSIRNESFDSSCLVNYLRMGGGGSTVEMTVVTFISSFWIRWKMGGGAGSRGIWLDTLLTPPHVVGIRGRATTILHTHIHSWGLPHETRSYAHTTTSKSLNNLKPKVSLPVSPLCFYQIFLLLGRSRGSNSAGLENFNLVYSSPPHHPFHLHVSLDQTVASRKLQLT